MKLYKFICLVFFAAMSLELHAAPWVDALAGNWKDWPEAKNLPPFCGTNPRYKHYKMNFRSSYLNHPCESLTKRNTCFKFNGNDRKKCFMAISKGFTYTLKLQSNPDFPLRPYLLSELALTYSYAGNYGDAVKAYSESIKANKKYIKAYAGLADVLIKLKNYKEAGKIIEQGLKYDPRSKRLIRRKDKIAQLIK
ncbi:MAG: tetratricopeptide repeat protein [Gammaproteobacteria bacterium]|nr:tetratricopeptide repeat protein [Gammaproteobacteria bacterium]